MADTNNNNARVTEELRERCREAGLSVVGPSIDGGIIVANPIDAARSRGAEQFGRLVPSGPRRTVVYGRR